MFDIILLNSEPKNREPGKILVKEYNGQIIERLNYRCTVKL